MELGGYPPEMEWHADWFTSQVIALRHGMCLVPEALAALRERSGSYSRSGMVDPPRQERVLRAIFRRLRSRDMWDVRDDFGRYPVILTALGDSLPRFLKRRPWYWKYLAYRYLWRFGHWLSAQDPGIADRGRGYVLAVRARTVLREILRPLIWLVRPLRPALLGLAARGGNAFPAHARAFRWLSYQIEYFLEPRR